MLCLCNLGAMADEQPTTKTDSLNVQTADGLKQFAIDNIRKIAFATDGLTVVENDGTETAYAYTDLTKLTFYLVTEDETPNGIAQLTTTTEVFRPSASATYYNLAGARVRELQKGQVYVVRDGSKTLKVIAR